MHFLLRSQVNAVSVYSQCWYIVYADEIHQQ